MVDTIDCNGNNVKKDVLAYMGPSHNFHGISITPKMLGYDSLTFTYLSGDTKTFTATEEITV
uniref:Uncharacterized protein n=1 Tax=Marseillevirus LCMAC201 TaxID=2506605 RepID=A0A481YYD3_9VIRU|nr:MAG: hypothetical protein LCMAC201_03860 [Marseillevirus LCMAC201]